MTSHMKAQHSGHILVGFNCWLIDVAAVEPTLGIANILNWAHI